MLLRCLHTADLHLDARFPALGAKAEQRRADFLKTFDRLVNLAIKSEVQLFLVAGDLFDNPTPHATVLAKVQAGLKRLADRGIVPVLLPGTHDHLASRESVYRREHFPQAVLLDAPQLREPVRIESNGTPIWLYGFAYRSGTSEELLAGMVRRDRPGLHIGLLHGARRGSPEWQHSHRDLPFDLTQLQALGLDYVALGHYHEFEALRDPSGRLLACYSGSPEGKRFGENGPRSCALVSFHQQQVEVERCAVHSRVLDERTLNLSPCSTQEEMVTRITALGHADLLLRLRLTGTVEVPPQLEVLQERCAEAFFYLELRDQTRFCDSRYAQRIAGEETVRGLFVRRAQQLLADSPPDGRRVIEDAIREVLSRFQAGDKGVP